MTRGGRPWDDWLDDLFFCSVDWVRSNSPMSPMSFFQISLLQKWAKPGLLFIDVSAVVAVSPPFSSLCFEGVFFIKSVGHYQENQKQSGWYMATVCLWSLFQMKRALETNGCKQILLSNKTLIKHAISNPQSTGSKCPGCAASWVWQGLLCRWGWRWFSRWVKSSGKLTQKRSVLFCVHQDYWIATF